MSGTVYGLRFRAYGRRHFLTLGSTADGWTRHKADTELQNIVAAFAAVCGRRRGLSRRRSRRKIRSSTPLPLTGLRAIGVSGA